MEEETGIYIQDINRFHFVNNKQLCSTLSSFHSYLYKVKLNKEEIELAKNNAQNNTIFGVKEDKEVISLEIIPLSKIMDYPLDYSMIGMIFCALSSS